MSTPQAPINSGFGAASTAADVIDGIDLGRQDRHRHRGLFRHRRRDGAGVPLGRRQGHRAGARSRQGRERARVRSTVSRSRRWTCIDPASIDAFAERFLASGRPLHILVNSAGIMATSLGRATRAGTSRSSRQTISGTSSSRRGCWPALRWASGARVVAVSSWGHRYSPVVFEDANFEHRDYDRWSAYGQSKTANILFALALDEGGKADGIRAFSLHPGGIVATGLGKHLSREELRAGGVIDEHGEADPRSRAGT